MANGKDSVIISSKEYENLMFFKKMFEFQPTSVQKRNLEKARKNRKKGEVLTLGELKNQLGLTD